MRLGFLWAIIAWFVCSAAARAQSPGILYTWNGTGSVHEWATSGPNFTTLSNSTAGQLTATEMGDALDPSIVGGAVVIRDGFNRRLESATEQGGLDLWGLEAIEIDLAHNGSGPVNVQFFVQARPAFDYVWAGSDGSLNGPDFSVEPGLQTLRFPLDVLTPEQQAYIRTIGLSVRDHTALGNLTWDIFEVRSTGTSPAVRDLATHDLGTSDNGLNGAFVNFEQGAVIGNDGSQNQTGLSHNPSASGSLQWTDRGNGGNTEIASGAAISWVNGTIFDGNTFNERLADFSNYDTLTFRISASDPLGAGGTVGVQAFFQTGNYEFQTTTGGDVGMSGEISLPVDGQFHDLVFPLTSVTNRQNVQAFGVNLFSHTNDLVMNVDLVQFNEVQELAGDYNNDGAVDAADYVVWRKSGGSPEGYDRWRANFGRMSGGVGLVDSSTGTVPEPSSAAIVLCGLAAILWQRTCAFAVKDRQCELEIG